MIEISHILCPVDFSDCSRRALQHAVALARWYGADVTALNAFGIVQPPIDPPPFAVEASYTLQTITEVDRQLLFVELQRFIAPLRAPGVPLWPVLVEGSPVHQILKYIQTHAMDLVVLGTHGRSGLERLLLGSVTEKVLRKAPCPVLTVPRDTPEDRLDTAQFKRILCPVDFSASSLRAVEYALSFAREADARLTLLHVVELLSDKEARIYSHFNVDEYRKLLEKDMLAALRASVPAGARDACTVDEVVTHGRASREILRVAADLRSDLIVMGAAGIDFALFGSTTAHVVREAVCPVLTLRAPTRAESSRKTGEREPEDVAVINEPAMR